MFKSETSDLNKSKSINSLVLDYLNQKEDLKPFYGYYPNLNGFSEILKTNPYSKLDRSLLVDVLLNQAQLVNNTSLLSKKNIESLKQKNVFTVTTGHQLCLFTGPLYFIYKIFSAINLAQELNAQFPEHSFIPVYWMASEDHDFEEVNHFYLFGRKYEWNSIHKGAVGDFKTNELNELLKLIKENFGASENAIHLTGLFEKAYLNHTTLKDATRFLVNELFGEYGLLVVDGHDKQLKASFSEILEKEIFDNTSYANVTKSSNQLNQLGYTTQVNPRLINCFYVDANLRARIEKNSEKYNVIGTEISFTEDELKTIIKNTPEKISPNVVLRPVYQQFILPNIAYVGGPGELAYWLQYKAMFNTLNIQFPILVPRNFITIIDKGLQNKIEKLNFTPEDFFKEAQELVHLQQLKSNNILSLDDEKEKFTELYQLITDKVSKVDKTLNNASLAEYQKAINGLDVLVTKANKALKQRSETEINQINAIKQKLFPNSIPQERFENFAGFYINYGTDFLRVLKQTIKPFKFHHQFLIEKNSI